MPACCSTFERAAEQQFSEKNAIAELKRYRKKGQDRDALASGWHRPRRSAVRDAARHLNSWYVLRPRS